METSVRIQVRVVMGQAIEAFNRLRGSINQFTSEYRASVGPLEEGSNRVSRGFDGMAAAGRRMVQAGRTLMFNFTLPLVGAFAALERQFLKNEQSMALLNQVYATSSGETLKFGQTTGRVADDLKTLDKIMTVLSNTYGIAKNKVIDLAVTFGRAGLSGVDLAKSVKTAIQLMAGFQVSTQQATDAVLQLGVSYNLSADEVANATAILSHDAQQTRADVSTLTAAFVKAAPAASQLGISIRELAGLISVMQQAGFKGAESGTALNFMMTRLVEATPKAIELFKKFGLELDSASYQAQSGSGRLHMIIDAMGKLSQAQQALAIADLFGVRQYPKALALLQDMIGKTSLYQQLMNQTADAAALRAEQENAVAIAMDNSATKFSILKTQLMNNFIIIANDLTPALLALADAAVRVSRWFAHLGDTAHGRVIQAILLTTAAVLAMLGPLALLVGSIETLIGVLPILGALFEAVFSPIGLAIAGAIALFVVFHRQVVAVLQAMYNDVLAVARAIYTALQWINPFARHSPSLVEQTRDGVALMVSYWKQLSPVLGMMDQASAAVKKLTAAMSGFTKAQTDANNAQMRAAVVKVSGPEAGKAFDAVLAANAKLAAQLPKIAALYDEQAKKVAAAKAALDAANKALDAASAKLDELQKKRAALQSTLDALGDPAALRSQAAAMSDMARNLSAAGNDDLAQQFAAQAKHLGDQADKAQAVQEQLNKVDAEIQSQQDAIAALTAQRDKLNATYDTENEKLQALADGYAAVQQQIDANTAALNQMGSAAEAALAAADAAKKGTGGGGSAFDAAAGVNFTAPRVPKVSTGSLQDFLKQVNQDQANLFGKLFPNPFAKLGGWISTARQQFNDFFSGLSSGSKNSFKFDTPTLTKVRDSLADISKNINFNKLRSDWSDAWGSMKEGFSAAWDKIKEPLSGLGETVRDSLGIITGIFGDWVEVLSKHVGPVLDGFARFWNTNGKQIGQIVGFISQQVIDLADFFLKVVNVVVKILWPVVKFTLDNILGVFEDLWQAIEGGLTFIIQLFTGNFTEAFKGLGDMFLGIGKAIWDGLKALAGVILLLMVALAGDIVGGLIAGLAELFPAMEIIGRKIPEWIWNALKLAWKGIVKLSEFIGEWLDTVAPGVLHQMENFARNIPKWMWNGVKAAGHGVMKLTNFIADWLSSVAPGITAHLETFAKKIPGWLWTGFKSVASKTLDLAGWFVSKLYSTNKELADDFVTFGVNMIKGIALGILQDGGAIGDNMVSAMNDAHNRARTFAGNASLSLPLMQQRVALQYQGMLDSLPGMRVPVSGSDGGWMAGGNRDGGNTTHQTTIQVDATKNEVGDPMALAQAIAWKQRTTVRP